VAVVDTVAATPVPLAVRQAARAAVVEPTEAAVELGELGLAVRAPLGALARQPTRPVAVAAQAKRVPLAVVPLDQAKAATALHRQYLDQALPTLVVAVVDAPQVDLRLLEVLAAAALAIMARQAAPPMGQQISAAVAVVRLAPTAAPTAARVSSSFGTRSKGTALWLTSHR
jgi:hypothetical protein